MCLFKEKRVDRPDDEGRKRTPVVVFLIVTTLLNIVELCTCHSKMNLRVDVEQRDCTCYHSHDVEYLLGV